MRTRRSSRLVIPVALAFGVAIVAARYEIVHGPAQRDLYWAFLPALPATLLAVLLLRHARDLDELERRLHLDALAIALAVLAISIVVVGLFQKAGILGDDATLWLLLAAVGSYLAGYWTSRRRFD